MIKTIENDVNLLTFNNLNAQSNLVHFISTRKGGKSTGLYSSLNLSVKVDDNIRVVSENRSILARAIGTTNEKILFPDQCHTNHIKEVDSKTIIQDLYETDALITNTKGICLCVLAADCVPVLLFDPVQRAIAAIHAGWRGTVGRIVPRTIERMVKSFSSRPENILAAIGPSVSQKNYEVGDEVAGKFQVFFHDLPAAIKKNKESGQFHIDLKEANKALLLRYGVQRKNIETSQECTYDMPELFYSARRDGFNCGRFGAGILLL